MRSALTWAPPIAPCHTSILPPQESGLVVGEPARFRFFGSPVRRQDQVGTRLDHCDAGELQEPGEIELALPAEGRTPGEIVPVKLCAAIREAGTLRLRQSRAQAPRAGRLSSSCAADREAVPVIPW